MRSCYNYTHQHILLYKRELHDWKLNKILMTYSLQKAWLAKALTQWCIAKNGGGYTQRGVAKGMKVPWLFMITEVSIRCQKKPGGWYTPYTRVYPPIHHCSYLSTAQDTWLPVLSTGKSDLAGLQVGMKYSVYSKQQRRKTQHLFTVYTSDIFHTPPICFKTARELTKFNKSIDDINRQSAYETRQVSARKHYM